jgi:hypothetical protein
MTALTVVGLGEFDGALVKLADVTQALDSALIQRQKVKGIVRFRVAVTARDVLEFCPIFRAALLEATLRSAEQTVHASKWRGVEVPAFESAEEAFMWARTGVEAMTPKEWASVADHLEHQSEMMRAAAPAVQRLQVSFKGLLYVIRAHQDNLYRVFNNLLGSRVTGGSMASALKAANPVGTLLREELPGYLPWFEVLRQQRNDMKSGADFNLAGPDGNLGLRFTKFDEASNGNEVDCSATAIRLGDIATALVHSKAAAGLALATVQRLRGASSEEKEGREEGPWEG